jgi:uncharacterized protein YjfI (DUF2170 family)
MSGDLRQDRVKDPNSFNFFEISRLRNRPFCQEVLDKLHDRNLIIHFLSLSLSLSLSHLVVEVKTQNF